MNFEELEEWNQLMDDALGRIDWRPNLSSDKRNNFIDCYEPPKKVFKQDSEVSPLEVYRHELVRSPTFQSNLTNEWGQVLYEFVDRNLDQVPYTPESPEGLGQYFFSHE